MATPVLFASLGSTLFALMLLFIAAFLILLVLVQRGRGGGLSGAFGGMGGQSAFGTKAGDTFTRITVATATIWIVLCIVAAKYLGTAQSRFEAAGSGEATQTRTINLDESTLGDAPLDAGAGGAISSGAESTVPAGAEGSSVGGASGGDSAPTPNDGGDAPAGGGTTPAEGAEN